MRGPVETTADMVSMCSLRAGAGLFGIDIKDIREVLESTTPQPVPLAPHYIAGVVPYRGEVLTTLSLRVLLGLEAGTSKGNVIVMDDTETGERFGLMVDSLGGVVNVPQSALEADQEPLNTQSTALFDGAYTIPSGLMVRLNLQQLRPSQLSMSEIRVAAKQNRKGESK